MKLRIKEESGFTKLQQLIHSVTEAIDTGVLKEGESLPSVNSLSQETGFSRDTVFKAYKILKQQSIIQSTPAKKYFVMSQSFRIFMLLDDFSAFKEQLYRSFRENLPDAYSVDLLFHHYNADVFRQLIRNSLGKYSIYIVMNIDNKGIDPVLKRIDPHKLLVLDMGRSSGHLVSYIIQDFNEAVIKCLNAGLEKIRKYDELIMVYSEKETPHPGETAEAFRIFCMGNGIQHRIVPRFQESKLEKGQAYFVIVEAELVRIIKTCYRSGFTPGLEVGIIAYNDSPMKEIAAGGITVVSTDFVKMGSLAADFVKSRKKIFEVIPTSLVLRATL